MDNSQFLVTSVGTIQLLTIFNHLNTLSEYLNFTQGPPIGDRLESIQTVNKLYDHFSSLNGASYEIKVGLIYKSLPESGVNSFTNEHGIIDAKIVDAVFNHISGKDVFGEYTNMYGFLLRSMTITEYMTSSTFKNALLNDLRSSSYTNDDGSISHLSNSAAIGISKEILFPLFPNEDIDVISPEYLYAQAGLTFARLIDMDMEIVFEDLIKLSKIVELSVRKGDMDGTALWIFAIPAVLYQSYSMRVFWFGEDVKEPGFWVNAYRDLFKYLSSTNQFLHEFDGASLERTDIFENRMFEKMSKQLLIATVAGSEFIVELTPKGAKITESAILSFEKKLTSDTFEEIVSALEKFQRNSRGFSGSESRDPSVIDYSEFGPLVHDFDDVPLDIYLGESVEGVDFEEPPYPVESIQIDENQFFTPLNTILQTSVNSFLNRLSSYLHKRSRLRGELKSQPIEILNALFKYMNHYESDPGIESIPFDSFLSKSDITSTNAEFADASCNYIFRKVVFEQFGNVYGFIIYYMIRFKPRLSALKNVSVYDSKAFRYRDSIGRSSFLSKTAFYRIWGKFISPFFPGANADRSVVRSDYLYAQAGLAFVLALRIDSNNISLLELIEISRFVESSVREGDLDGKALKIFALPAVLYYEYPQRFSISGIPNYINDTRFWGKAYRKLFNFLNPNFRGYYDVNHPSTKKKLSNLRIANYLLLQELAETDPGSELLLRLSPNGASETRSRIHRIANNITFDTYVKIVNKLKELSGNFGSRGSGGIQ